MPQWYQVEVSLSGVMRLTTIPVTPLERSPLSAPLPASATPTSIMTFAGKVKLQICQRSHFSNDRRFDAQNGGGSMLCIQRVTRTEVASEVTLIGASRISCCPMLDGCTNVSCDKSIKLSTRSW